MFLKMVLTCNKHDHYITEETISPAQQSLINNQWDANRSNSLLLNKRSASVRDAVETRCWCEKLHCVYPPFLTAVVLAPFNIISTDAYLHDSCFVAFRHFSSIAAPHFPYCWALTRDLGILFVKSLIWLDKRNKLKLTEQEAGALTTGLPSNTRCWPQVITDCRWAVVLFLNQWC